MKYSYKFRPVELGNGKKAITIDLPKEIELVSAFLTHIGNIKAWYIEAIDEVLSGKMDCIERDGEFYGLEIRIDFTRVHDVFDQGTECIIETSEMRGLLEIWFQEKDKLDDNYLCLS